MHTTVPLSTIPLGTKVRLLLPEWPGRLRFKVLSSRRFRCLVPNAALDTALPPQLPPPLSPTEQPPPSPHSPVQLSRRPRVQQTTQWPDHRSTRATATAVATSDQSTPVAAPGSIGAPKAASLGECTEAAAAMAAESALGGSSSSRSYVAGEDGNGRSEGRDRGATTATGGSPASVWSQVRGADLNTWVALVTEHGSSRGALFAVNALFRAAHFVNDGGSLVTQTNIDGDGDDEDNAVRRTRHVGSTEMLVVAHPIVTAAGFSSLVQQLLVSVTDMATSGKLDSIRTCHLLWAVAKLSGSGRPSARGGAGSESASGLSAAGEYGVGLTEGGVITRGSTRGLQLVTWETEGEEGGGVRRRNIEGPIAAQTRGGGGGSNSPALPRSIMRALGGRCVTSLAALLLQHLAEEVEVGSRAQSRPDHRPAAHSPSVHSAGGDNVKESHLHHVHKVPGRKGRNGKDVVLSGRLVVMAMWGLARLTAEGHMGGGADKEVSPRELWGGLCAVLRTRLQELSAREISNAMWALAVVRHCRDPVFEQLAQALEPHLRTGGGADASAGVAARSRLAVGATDITGGGGGRYEGCNVQDLVNAVWAIARAATSSGEGGTFSRLMHLAEAAVLRQLPQLRSQHVASLLWSFVKLRYRPVGHALTPNDDDATAAPRLSATTLPPPESSLASWSPSADVRSTGPLPQGLFSLLEQRAGELRLIERADEGIVAQVVWALCKERLASGRLLELAARRLGTGAGRLTLREIALVASAYREARYMDPRLFSSLLRRASLLPDRELRTEPHADVSIALLLRGLAWAGCYDQAVYTRLCTALRAHLPSIQPQPLALALWALAEAQHRQLDFLAPATTVATAIVGLFSGGELSCVAVSLARLGVRNADFFRAAAVTLTALRGGGRSSEGGIVKGGSDADNIGGLAAAELVPGEAAPVYGEDEEEEEEDEQDEEDEEEEEGEEEVEGLGEEEEDDGAGGGMVLSKSFCAVAVRQCQPGRRRRNRGGRRYWVSRAAAALHSTRWRRIDLLNPQELANVMAAFAISGNVDETLYYRAQIHTRRLLNASSVLRRDAASAAAGGGGTAAATSALRRGEPVAGNDMSAAAVTKLLWAFVAIGVQEPPLLCALASRLRQLMQRLEPRDISALAWALAVARLPNCDDLLAKAVRTAAEHAHAFTPADLATVAWASATVGVLNRGLMDACSRLLGSVPSPDSVAAAPNPSLKVVSDVVWAHSALRLYNPQLLGRAAELAEASLMTAAAAPVPEVPVMAPWLAPDLELQHIVALLQAYANWVAGPHIGCNSGGKGGGECSCYHDGLFRAAVPVLIPRLDELTSDELVTLTWCCAAVLHVLPPPRPSSHELLTPDAVERCHPMLELLAALSELLAATNPHSFLQSELMQLAQVHAMSIDYAAKQQAVDEHGRSGGGCGSDGGSGPLVLPTALLQRISGVRGTVPAVRMRRSVVELCAVLDELGFRQVEIDTRSEDGLVPVDVGAVGPPASDHHHHQQQLACKVRSAVVEPGNYSGGSTARRYAFLVAMAGQQAVGQEGVFWGPLGVRVRLLQARGWVVVVLPKQLGDGGRGWEVGGRPSQGKLTAGHQRKFVREVLQVALRQAGEEWIV